MEIYDQQYVMQVLPGFTYGKRVNSVWQWGIKRSFYRNEYPYHEPLMCLIQHLKIPHYAWCRINRWNSMVCTGVWFLSTTSQTHYGFDSLALSFFLHVWFGGGGSYHGTNGKNTM